ncbi:MAG: hypothetical protein ACHQIM_06600 [Sphingobacteriales bacterium]
MRNPETLHIATINADWCDKDIVMLHACFQLLTNFVEEELSKDIANWDYDENVKNARKEIDYLYNWWKDRLRREAEQNLDPIWNKGQYESDNEMLIRLIKVREYLWT